MKHLCNSIEHPKHNGHLIVESLRRLLAFFHFLVIALEMDLSALSTILDVRDSLYLFGVVAYNCNLLIESV